MAIKHLDLVDPDFYKRAACRGADPNLFFDRDHEGSYTPSQGETLSVLHKRLARDRNTRRAIAKEYCDRCPVVERCLELGFTATDGIFGGLDKDERRHILRRQRRAAGDTTVTEEQRTETEAYARLLYRRGKGVREVMAATGLDYQSAVGVRPAGSERVVRRPDPPTRWAPGCEVYWWWERRWCGGQYLGTRHDGKVLVQSRNNGPTVRKWCKPEDVVIRPDVQRYGAQRHSRKDINATPEAVGAVSSGTDDRAA